MVLGIVDIRIISHKYSCGGQGAHVFLLIHLRPNRSFSISRVLMLKGDLCDICDFTPEVENPLGFYPQSVCFRWDRWLCIIRTLGLFSLAFWLLCSSVFFSELLVGRWGGWACVIFFAWLLAFSISLLGKLRNLTRLCWFSSPNNIWFVTF